MPASVKAPGGAKRGDEAAQGLALEPKPVHQGEHFLLAKVGNEPRALVQLKPEVTGAKTGKRFRGSEAGMRPLPFSSVPSSAVEEGWLVSLPMRRQRGASAGTSLEKSNETAAAARAARVGRRP